VVGLTQVLTCREEEEEEKKKKKYKKKKKTGFRLGRQEIP